MAWRFGERGGRFAREVGSVVLGVLIALGLGAVATDVGWRIEVAEARDAIRAEIADNLALARDRGETAPCVERRLDTLAAILLEASRTRRLLPLGIVSSPGRPGFSTGVWQSFVSAQTIAHFPAAERATLSQFARNIEEYREVVDSDARAWRTLAMMTGPGRPLDAGTESALYAALGDARYANESLLGSLAWFEGILRRSGLGAGYARSDVGVGIAPVRLICAAVPAAAPAVYGQSPTGGRSRFRSVPPVPR